MFRKLGLAVLFIALGSVTALAADFNGKWSAQVETPRGTQDITFNFHVNGSALTGTISTRRGDMAIQDGKVNGDNISFDQVLHFNGNEFKITYTGKTDGANAIKFTRQFGDRGSQQFTAKKEAESSASPSQQSQ